jgi:hypothetical protein
MEAFWNKLTNLEKTLLICIIYYLVAILIINI